jgi:peroxin-6
VLKSQHDIVSFPVSSIHHNETVFFIITNVEHDVFSSNASTHDMYVGSAVGELGCWIDSTITRIIQTGVEHSRVPIVEVYMGIGTIHNVYV